jgi:hypothetical protein
MSMQRFRDGQGAQGRGLEVGDPRYRARPRCGGAALAARIAADELPLVVTGPTGVGKSTELAAAVAALSSMGWLANWVRLDDVFPDGGAASAAVLHHAVASRLTEALSTSVDATELPSTSLVSDLRASDPHFSRGFGLVRPTDALARAAAGELSAAHENRPVALLIDGLDRLSDDVARSLALALTDLIPEVRIAATVAPTLVYGEDAFLLLDRVYPFAIGNLDPEAEVDRQFLVEVAHGRGDAAPEAVLARAARSSGGMIGSYLRLVAACHAAAHVAGRELPNDDDVAQAERDQSEQVRRLLLRGDLGVILEAEGTDGVEVPPERRARLLAQGLLIEYGVPPDVVVRAHPAVHRLVMGRSASKTA